MYSPICMYLSTYYLILDRWQYTQWWFHSDKQLEVGVSGCCQTLQVIGSLGQSVG